MTHKIWIAFFEMQVGADGESSEISDVQVFTTAPDDSIYNDTRRVSVYEREVEL